MGGQTWQKDKLGMAEGRSWNGDYIVMVWWEGVQCKEHRKDNSDEHRKDKSDENDKIWQKKSDEKKMKKLTQRSPRESTLDPIPDDSQSRPLNQRYLRKATT